MFASSKYIPNAWISNKRELWLVTVHLEWFRVDPSYVLSPVALYNHIFMAQSLIS
jgi:hypothetical protein